MKIDINKVLADLLANNKRSQDDPVYKEGYVDATLAFYNIVKKATIKKEKTK